MLDKTYVENLLCELPIAQYVWISSDTLPFSERVRTVCLQECPMYGKSWACPPAVGTVDECRERCLRYPEALLLTTVTEVNDIADLDETLATRTPHEELVRKVETILRTAGCTEVYVLSTEACSVCERCAYLDGKPCRSPEKMYPCVESHGIVATELAERCGIDFFTGNYVTWFSVLLYHPQQHRERFPKNRE